MTQRHVLPFLVLASTLLAHGSPARACSPPLPGLTSSIPKAGETYPGNAALFFSGFDITLDQVTAEIDGQPATLVPVPELTFGGAIAATLDPPPAEGQSVTIDGMFCQGEPSGCKPGPITFTAAAFDTKEPPSTEIESFDMYDYADFASSGGDCQVDSDVGYWVHLRPVTLEPGESPRVITTKVFPASGGSVPLLSVQTFLAAGSPTQTIRLRASQLGGKAPAEAVCFQIETSDAAGQTSSRSLVECKPCHARTDPPGTPASLSPPPEPEWTEADALPGGPCFQGTGGAPPGTSTGAGGAADEGVYGEDDGTCLCGVAGGSRSGATWPTALLLAGLATATARRARRREVR